MPNAHYFNRLNIENMPLYRNICFTYFIRLDATVSIGPVW